MNMEHTRVFLYADDAKLLAPAADDKAIAEIQSDIDRLSRWCVEWRLKLNPKKCFFLHYTPRNSSTVTSPRYILDATEIERKATVSDLGVLISQDLSFHEHIDHICKTANREINRIRRSFRSRDPDFLSGVYKTYVRPGIEYAEPVWNPVYIGDSEKLEKVQNKFTKLLKHGSVMSPEERNDMLGLTDHKTRRLRGDLIQLYKFSESGRLNRKPDHSIRRRIDNTKAIIKTRSRTNIRAHTFINRNTNIWNALPEQVVSADSVNAFKSEIDQYLTKSR